MTQKATFFIVGAVFLFVAGFLLGQHDVLFMSCMLLAVLVTAHLTALYSVKRLDAELRAPRRLHEGEAMPFRLRLTSLSRFPKFFLSVLCPAGDGLSVTPEQGHFVPYLPPQGTEELEMSLKAERRGVYALGPAHVRSSDPVGTATAESSAGQAAEIIVYPSFPKVDLAPAVSGGKPGLYQEREQPTPGLGREFHFIRPYQPGDDFRRIHWKTTARTGEISVIEAERPAVRSLSVFFYFPPDSLVGSGAHTNLEHAVKIAAGMAWAILRAGGQFRVTAMGSDGLLTAEARGLAELERVLEALARTQANRRSQPVAAELTRLRRRRGALDHIVVFAGRADAALGEALGAGAQAFRTVTLFLADRDAFAERSQRPQWLEALATGAQRGAGAAGPAVRPPLAAHPATRRAAHIIQVTPSADLRTLIRQGCLLA